MKQENKTVSDLGFLSFVAAIIVDLRINETRKTGAGGNRTYRGIALMVGAVSNCAVSNYTPM